MSDIMERVRDAFDGDDVPAKNLALRHAYIEIDRMRAIVERVEAIYSDWYEERFTDGDAMSAIAGVLPDDIPF